MIASRVRVLSAWDRRGRPVAIRPPSRTTKLEDLPPGEESPSLDDLVHFDDETTGAFVARTGAQEPARLGAGDAVPVLRADLEIAKGSSPGLFEVGDPATGRHFTLYEFELSIARMLDGRRHASDVIDNGVRLGIPVDLEGLNKFIRQLWRYGFLAPPGAIPEPAEGEESGWGERARWDEATRTLFQTGLRLVRQGRPQDAESYLHAVLDADPHNAEAQELLAAIARGETLVAAPIGARGPGGGRPASASRRALAIFVGAAFVAASAAAAVVVVVRRTPPPPVPPVAAPAPAPAPRPPPAWRTAAVQRREHPSLGEVVAPASGVVGWRKASGDRVAQGERIGVIRVEGPSGRAAAIDPVSAARIKELEALAARDPVYRDFLEKERRAVARKRAPRATRELPLTAPAAGVLALGASDRSRVQEGASLATVVDGGVWRVDAFLDGEPPSPDASCELRGDSVAERAPCSLGPVRPKEGGSELAVEVAAEVAPWLGPSRSLRVRVAPPGTPPEPEAAPPSRQGAE